jgi:hypothetical protein
VSGSSDDIREELEAALWKSIRHATLSEIMRLMGLVDSYAGAVLVDELRRASAGTGRR